MRNHTLRVPGPRRRDQRGFTLIEVMVAAFLVIIIMLALAQYYWRGRVQTDYEEHRRKATAAGQLRLDELRRARYDRLADYDGTDTTLVVDGRQYRVAMQVVPESPTVHSTTLTATITWDLLINPGQPDDERSATITTVVGRTVELYP